MMSTAAWVEEEARRYGTFFPRCADTRDAEVIIARERQGVFRHEFFLACAEELRKEEEDRLVALLRQQFPSLTMKKVREIVVEHLREEKFPKTWRVKKRMTEKRKEWRKEREGAIEIKEVKEPKPVSRKKELYLQRKFIKEHGITHCRSRKRG